MFDAGFPGTDQCGLEVGAEIRLPRFLGGSREVRRCPFLHFKIDPEPGSPFHAHAALPIRS